MAVELMTGYSNNNFINKMEESAVQEAAAAGLKSVENLIRLLSRSQEQHLQKTQQQNPSFTPMESNSDYRVVADVAVNKFRKFISLLDRSRTGHARFRRGPVPNQPNENNSLPDRDVPIPIQIQNQNQNQNQGPVSSVPKVYCPTPIQRLPPLPYNHHHQLVKTGSIERKEPATTINFASATASQANSFMSSLTGDTESLQPSMSSGFQITNLSQVSSAGRPPLSSSSFKRKCSSMDDSAVKCSGSSGRCHCHKKRYDRN